MALLKEEVKNEEITVDTTVDTTPSTSMMTSPVNAGGNTIKEMKEAGFEGLELDWTSYPSISLKPEGIFVDVDGTEYGAEISFRLMTTKNRYIYRAEPVHDNRTDIKYSYDKQFSSTGESLKEIFQQWKEQGKHVVEKNYIEAFVELVAPGEIYDGESRILSISPMSKGRFSSKAVKAFQKGKGDTYSVIMKAKRGAKITKVQNPFYPWDFEVL